MFSGALKRASAAGPVREFVDRSTRRDRSAAWAHPPPLLRQLDRAHLKPLPAAITGGCRESASITTSRSKRDLASALKPRVGGHLHHLHLLWLAIRSLGDDYRTGQFVELPRVPR